MARGDILVVGLPESDKREEKGNRPAITVQTDVANLPMLMVVPVTSSLRALSAIVPSLDYKIAALAQGFCASMGAQIDKQ